MKPKFDRKKILFRTVDGVLKPVRMSELNIGDVVTIKLPDGHQTTFKVSLQMKMSAETREALNKKFHEGRQKRRERPAGVKMRKRDGDDDRGHHRKP